eukprot:scaffold441_cov139-Skeletonema_marinoi.AAC.1
MLLQRELLSLTIAAFAASSNVSAASDHHLRGSNYTPVCGVDGTTYSNRCYAGAANVEVDYEGECLKPTSGGAEAPLPTDGAAEEPTDGGDTTVTIIEAECEPACDSGQVCAHEYSGATAQCYDRCSAFPLSERDVCTGTCVYSIFTSCNGYASVFDEYCECGNSGSNTYADGCRTSECGLGLFGRQ